MGAAKRRSLLVVEDDPAFREMLAGAVGMLGSHHVLAAAGGPAALARCREHGEPIDLVVSDVVMPGMEGPELVGRLSAMYPAIQAIYVSGLSERQLREEGRLAPEAVFLHKPFSLDDLLEMIRALLNGAPSSQTPSLAFHGRI